MLIYIETSISLIVSHSIQWVNHVVIEVEDGAIVEGQVKMKSEVEVFLGENQFDTIAELI